jgi:hypothetical protein
LNARSITLLAVATTIAVFLAGGCGGTDSSSSTSSSTEASAVTKAEFLAKANAACKEAGAGLAGRISFYRRRAAGRPPERLNADLAHYVLLPTIEAEMEAIRAFILPPAEQDRVNEILYAEEQAYNAVFFTKKLASLAAAERRFTESGKLLSAYGLTACANGLEPNNKGA